MTNTDLKELLDALHDKYNSPDFIADDPISVPHRYTDRADREIAGFFSATIAWGNRKAIVRSGHRMMHFMDDAPADFVRNASQRELALLSSYVHRTFNGGDLRDFVLALRRMEERHGGIGNFFETRYEAAQSMPAMPCTCRSATCATPSSACWLPEAGLPSSFPRPKRSVSSRSVPDDWPSCAAPTCAPRPAARPNGR